MQHQTGANLFSHAAFTLEYSFPLSHCIFLKVISALSCAIWLQSSIRHHVKFRSARLPPKVLLLSLASPRYDTIAAAVLGHVRELVPADVNDFLGCKEDCEQGYVQKYSELS